MRRTIFERLWGKIDKTSSSQGCWLWQGSTTKNGYGQICFEGRNYGAHVLSYIFTYGPIPNGYDVDHVCEVRLCIRPDHLEAITRKENLERARESRRRRQTLLQEELPPIIFQPEPKLVRINLLSKVEPIYMPRRVSRAGRGRWLTTFMKTG